MDPSTLKMIVDLASQIQQLPDLQAELRSLRDAMTNLQVSVTKEVGVVQQEVAKIGGRQEAMSKQQESTARLLAAIVGGLRDSGLNVNISGDAGDIAGGDVKK